MPTLTMTMGIGRTFYMSPTGSDAADGGILTPFETLRSRVGGFALRPGDTVLARGGTYYESGGPGSTWIPEVGGRAGSPITVKAYPNEVPIFDGISTVGQSFVLADMDWMVFEDLKFTNFHPLGNGNFIISGSTNITLRRIHMYTNPGAQLWTDHAVYIGGASKDILIADSTITGTTGAAVQISVGSGNPGNIHNERVVVSNCTFTNNGFGVIDQFHDDGRIEYCVISTNSECAFRISNTLNNEIHHNDITSTVGFTFSPPPPTQEFSEHDNCVSATTQFQDYGAPTNYTLAQWVTLSGEGAGDTSGPC